VIRRPLRAAERWLLAPGSAHRLALLRIAVGCYAVGWVIVLAPELLALTDVDRARYDPLGVVAVLHLRPLSSGALAGLVAGTVVAGAGFVLGWRYRLSAPAFAAGLLVLTTYQNSWGKVLHTENLLVVHVLVLAASPAAAALSVHRRPAGGHATSYGWPVRVMALATVGAYLAAGTTKLQVSGLAWVDPDNLRSWVAYDLVRKDLFGDPYLPLAPGALEHAWVFGPAAVLTLLVELGAPLALLGRRVARSWVVGAWGLHVAVLLTMSVAFPYQLTGIPLAAVLLAAPGQPGATSTRQPPPRLAAYMARSARATRDSTSSPGCVSAMPTEAPTSIDVPASSSGSHVTSTRRSPT
jgi:hypothetical protein